MKHAWREIIWPAKPQPAQSKKIAVGRLWLGGLLALLCFSTIGAKAFYLATNGDLRSQFRIAQSSDHERGIITNRHGKVLATSLPVMILYDPADVGPL